jgi:hypothetical protein
VPAGLLPRCEAAGRRIANHLLVALTSVRRFRVAGVGSANTSIQTDSADVYVDFDRKGHSFL